MAQKKSSTSKKREKKQEKAEKSKFSKQIKAIIIMAVALFIFAIVLIPIENMGSF